MASISAVASATPTYTLTDIGTLNGGIFSHGYAINNAGTVVGQTDNPANFNPSSFTYSNGVLKDAFLYGGDNGAWAVNSSGLLAGQSNTFTGVPHAMTISNGVAKDLGSLAQFGGASSYASGVNDNGVVVGSSQVNNGSTHAFLYDGTLHDLGTSGGSGSGALDINNQGTVVGYSLNAAGETHGFYYKNGIMTTISKPGEVQSVANAINENGQIVGAYNNTQGYNFQAYLYSNGVMQDLGSLGGTNSQAVGINLAGDVVGYSNTASGKQSGFLYTGGTMLDLNSILDGSGAGFRVFQANGINDSGWIAGTAELADHTYHAVLLRPQAVPEPASLAVLSLGGLVLVRHRRKK